MPTSATSVSKGIELAGVVETPTSNLPISLADPNEAVVVTRGKLDFFVTASRGGEPEGARRPVMRIEAGGAAIGVEAVDGVMLIACPAPGTCIVRMPTQALFRAHANAADATGSLVEGWVHSLAEVVGIDRAPLLAPLAIGPGDVVETGEDPKVIASKSQVTWVAHRRGLSGFLGIESKLLNGDSGLFPLTRQCWLETKPGAEVYAARAGEHDRLDPEWDGLRKFSKMALAILAERFREAKRVDQERLTARARSDNAVLHRTMQRLASPINALRQVVGEDDSCAHPVFLACQAIATRAGFRVQPHPDLLRGIPVKDPVAAIARASNVRVRRVTLKGQWWTSEVSGLLCFQEGSNDALAILPGKRGLEVLDPKTQMTVALTPKIAETINPSAYFLYKPFPATALGAADLARFALGGSYRELYTILATGTAIGLLGMLVPYATGIVFDQLIPGAERGALVQMCLFLAVAVAASSLMAIARGYAVLRLQGRMDSTLQAAVWDRLLSLPVSFFRDYSSGDLAQRSLGIAKIREVLTGTTLNAVLSGIFSIFSFAMLFSYSWRLALVATALVLTAGAISLSAGLVRLAKQREQIHLEGKISSVLLQFITGVAKFRVSATESRAFSSWGRQFGKLKTLSTGSRRIGNRLNIVTAVFPLFSNGVFFICYYAYPSFSESMTTGDFVAFLAAYGQFLASVLTLSTAAVNALSIVPLFERATPILRAIPEVTESKTTPGRLNGSIELNHLTFRYRQDGPPVLHDIDLKINAGEFVAFVGASGSGKSTLFRLLLGFEKPASGGIYFDGQDLAGLDIQSVRRQIGVVLQTSKPVSGSIFDNIVGSAPLSVDDAWNAAKDAGFDADIRRMPMGMHTHIADGGGGISGGQRQRLLIARAIVAKPRMLFFDEATSALDNRTQEIVTRSLDGLQATRVVIAHRLSTILNADRIFVLDKGTIAQSGSYAQLMQQEGLFRTLAERQTA